MSDAPRSGAFYADGYSHSISLLPFAALVLSSRLAWHDFAHVTMARKVHSSTLVHPLHPNPSFLERSGPYMPVAPDPRRNPRGGAINTYKAVEVWGWR